MHLSLFLKQPQKASLLAGLCLLLFSFSGYSASDKSTNKQLKEVQQELKKRQANLEQRQKQQKQAQAELRSAELKLARQAKVLHQTRSQVKENETQQTGLKGERAELQKTRKAQQEVLAAQLQSHFMAGSSDYLKMLFNQQNPSKVERTLTYFEYLNQARVEALTELQKTEAGLQRVAEQLLAKQNQLEELLAQQSKQQASLKNEQQKHQSLVANIGQRVRSEQESIELLEESEQQLKSLMDSTLELRSTVRLSGLTKGKLSWPSKGRIRHRYNSIRQGQIRWKGVLLSSQSGANVNAIANGKVLFADWVRGMGLVMVLDHGKDYLSVYGHAQTLLRQAGDEVRVGDTIALVGQSGGQSQPSLYFEMRYKGKPVNPSHWCR